MSTERKDTEDATTEERTGVRTRQQTAKSQKRGTQAGPGKTAEDTDAITAISEGTDGRQQLPDERPPPPPLEPRIVLSAQPLGGKVKPPVLHQGRSMKSRIEEDEVEDCEKQRLIERPLTETLQRSKVDNGSKGTRLMKNGRRRSIKGDSDSEDARTSSSKEDSSPMRSKSRRDRPRKTGISSDDVGSSSDRKNQTLRRRKHDAADTTLDASDTDALSEDEGDRVRRSRRHRKEISLDFFSGQSAETTIETYLSQFRGAARHNRWPRSEWGAELALRLRGAARTLIFADPDPDISSFSRLVKRLKRHFEGEQDASYYENEVHDRRRKDKESIRDLEQWMTVNGRRAFPEISRGQKLDCRLRRYFEDALTNTEQREYVKNRDCKNMAEAARAALRWESRQKGEEQRNRPATATDKKTNVRIAVSQVTGDGEVEENSSRSAAMKTTAPKPPAPPAAFPRTAAAPVQNATSAQGTISLADLSQIIALLRATENSAAAAPAVGTRPSTAPRYPPSQDSRRTDGTRAATNGRCYNCGSLDHLAAHCPNATRCFNCDGTGHIAGECTYAARCNHCKGENHSRRDCPVLAERRQRQSENEQGGSRNSGATVRPKQQ